MAFNARRRICFTRRLFVYMSVCLSDNINFVTDFYDNFTRDVTVDKEENVKF